MKENKYDDPAFFEQYSKMDRSVKGLQGAGEWHVLEKMLPEFTGKNVLDLGCGFGWHCSYAIEHGAKSVIGIDISTKMIEEAKKRNPSPLIQYINMPIEEIDFPANSFDIVISSLTFHYIESFADMCKKISQCMIKNGVFIFSVEHPVFTAYGNQDWYYDENGNILHWPVDRYYEQGKRTATFLGEKVIKYHRTLTGYINDLLSQGFEVTQLIEPEPSESLLKNIPEMKNELRRPMFLIISAKKTH